MLTLRGLRATSRIWQYFFLGFLTCFSLTSEAQFQNATFWRNRAWSLQYSTTGQSIYAGNCSGITTVRTYRGGILANVSSNITVSLSGPGTVTFYSDPYCTASVSQVTVTSGTNSTSFYFIDTSTSSIDLTVSAANFKPATQTQTLNTNPYVWTGGGGNTSWSTGANWSGGAAPGPSNVALFNSICSSNCSPLVNSNISVTGVRMESGYSGTITQNTGNTIAISSYWVQYAGTFAGSNSNITNNGGLIILGGSFTSTSGTLTVLRSLQTSAGLFTHNSGSVTLGGNGTGALTVSMGGAPLYNASTATSFASTTLTGTLEVLNNLSLAGGATSLNGGTINAYKDITISGGLIGSTLVRAVGSTNQTISGSNIAHYIGNLEIASTGGTVTLSGTFGVYTNLTYTSGVVDPGTSTVRLGNNSSGAMTVSMGAASLYNVTVATCFASTAVTGTLVVLNNFTGGCNNSLNGGTVNVYKDITISGSLSGSTLVRAVGSTNQTISGSSTSHVIGNLEIASTGGTVTLSGTFGVLTNLTYTSGTVDAGTSTVRFGGNGTGPVTVSMGAAQLYNVSTGTSFSTTTITGTLGVLGDLALTGSSTSTNGGLIELYGNLSISNGSGGTTSLTFKGTNTQTVTRTAGSYLGGDIIIDKPSGSVVLTSATSWNSAGQDLTITAGTLNMAGHNLTIGSGNITNSDILQRGTSGSCGTLTYSGSYSGNAPVCP